MTATTKTILDGLDFDTDGQTLATVTAMISMSSPTRRSVQRRSYWTVLSDEDGGGYPPSSPCYTVTMTDGYGDGRTVVSGHL